MINPNQNTSNDVLRRLKEGSYERMRVELMNSVESKMRDFQMSWDDLGRLLGGRKYSSEPQKRATMIRKRVIQGQLTVNDLNTLAHVFSCEPYILFRPREPWVKT